MKSNEMKVDLLQMAMDAGMTESQFKAEIGIIYATYASLFLSENPGQMISHTVSFADHDVVIETRRKPHNKSQLN
ncbi:MAG: hypothetical protein H0X02_06740 [Nitrosomonas sp.]|nr:hypothetical protein [Nitrosomonas sp.]